jgi:hypothetical protein
MSDIYRQHDAAFALVSAYVVLDQGERVATVALKRSASGLRVTAFVHWIGTEMVKGHADGGGYDKNSAAVENALHRALTTKHALMFAEPGSRQEAFALSQSANDGRSWDRRLADAGFNVLQAV